MKTTTTKKIDKTNKIYKMKVNWITYSFLSSMASLSFSCFFFTSAAAEVLSYIVSKVAIYSFVGVAKFVGRYSKPFFQSFTSKP